MTRAKLMETLEAQMAAIKKNYGVKNRAPEKMTYAEYLYYLYEDTYNKLDGDETGKLVAECEEMFNSVESYFNAVSADNMMNEKCKPNAYKYVNLFRGLCHSFNDSDYFRSVTVPNPQRIATKMSIQTDIQLETLGEKIQTLCNHGPENPVLGKFKSNTGKNPIESIRDVISTHFNVNAKTREGAVPFIYCAFLSLENEERKPKYTFDAIIKGEVSQDDYNLIYGKIMNLSNSETKEDALRWCDDAFVKGMFRTEKIFDDFVNSEEIKNGKYVDVNMGVVSSILHIGNTNYFQDNNFDSRIKASEERLINNGYDLSYKGGTFDVAQAFSANEGEFSSYASEVKTAFLKDVIELTDSNSNLFYRYISLVAASNCDVLDMAPYASLSGKMELSEETASLMNKQDRFAFSLFLIDCMKNGKGLQDLYFSPEDDEIKTKSSIDGFIKEFKEFEKTHQEEIGKFCIDKVLEKDEKALEITNENINNAKEINEKLTKYLYVANAAGANRFETIFNNVNELENKIMAAQNFRSQGNLEKLDNILKNLKKYHEKTGPEKYDYLGLSKEGKEEKREEVLQFTEISEAEGKEFDENSNNKKLNERMGKEFDKKIIDIKNLASLYMEECEEKVADFKLSVSKEELANIDKEIELSVAVSGISELRSNEDYRKVVKAPRLEESSKRVSEVYGNVLDKLKATSALDKEGNPIGNTDLFNKMYESIKKVAEFKDNRATSMFDGMSSLMREANANIREYIKERDSFIKFSQKGRDRLDITKSNIEKLECISEKYETLSDSVYKKHNEAIKAISPREKELLSARKENEKKSGRSVVKTNTLEKGMGGKE